MNSNNLRNLVQACCAHHQMGGINQNHQKFKGSTDELEWNKRVSERNNCLTKVSQGEQVEIIGQLSQESDAGEQARAEARTYLPEWWQGGLEVFAFGVFPEGQRPRVGI